MAVLYISEFRQLSSIGTTVGQFPPQPSLVDQAVALSGSSAQSAPFSAATQIVIVTADEACSIKFGSNPTATTSNFRLPANVPMIFGVAAGQIVAAIANT